MSFTPEHAKQFLVTKVVQEASRSGISLSQAERAMLQFSEEHARLPESIIQQFETETTDADFEEKIVSLLKNALKYERGSISEYREARQALRQEDHYLGVMVEQAFGGEEAGGSDLRLRSPKDVLLLFASGVAVVAFFLLAIWFMER